MAVTIRLFALRDMEALTAAMRLIGLDGPPVLEQRRNISLARAESRG